MKLQHVFQKIAGALLVVVSLSASSFAVAEMNPNSYLGGNRGHAPYHCVQANRCCEPECCNPPPACGVAYNPEAYFVCKGCCNNGGFIDSLRFRADFLWWKPSVDCFSLGTEFGGVRFPEGKQLITTREKLPDYKYQPGFRIGLATVCPCDCYDIALNWTHFHSKATVNGKSDLQDKEDFTIFISDWQTFADAIPDLSKGRWALDLDLVDLEFGRKFYVSNCFILRPNFGLRGARIDQSFRVHASANRSLDQRFFSSDTNAKNNFLGIGPRVGLDLELALPCLCNFKLFGQAAGSLLFGRFERHAHSNYDFLGGDVESNYIDVDYKARATKNRSTSAVTDLAIGIKWEKCCNWCNRSHPITLAVSWEHHAFFDLNNFVYERGFAYDNELSIVPTVDHRCGGNLSTQGLTVSAEIGF